MSLAEGWSDEMKQKGLVLRTAEDELLNHAVEGQQSPEISTVCALLNDSALYDCCIGNHTGYCVSDHYYCRSHVCDICQYHAWNAAWLMQCKLLMR